jgi:uncharacterized protein YqeY
MTLKSTLDDHLKQAMRSRDNLRRDVIRYLKSEIRNQEIKVQHDLDDQEVIQVLARQAQQRRDSIEAFQAADREDLVQREQSELALIMEYLPQQMTEQEIAELVQNTVVEIGAQGPSDMGRVMGRIMPQVRGRAEGRVVSATVSRILREL